MRGKFIRGITTGAIIGATAGMMIMPQLSRTSQRKIKKSGRMLMNFAEDIYDGMKKGYMK